MTGLAAQIGLLGRNVKQVSLAAFFAAALHFGVAPCAKAQHMVASATAPGVSTAAEPVRHEPSTIVIGFMGGRVRRDSPDRNEVRLAAKLREEYSNGAYVDTYENARWKDARAKILSLLDADHDGKLSAEEKQHARIILFGHSWGASATVTLARDLHNLGIPVLLTVQVDSVQKIGQQDEMIPANVAEAMNFFQPDGLLHGRKLIRAEDPSKTRILGNQEFDYKRASLSCKGYPWHQRVFAKEHMYIECDPQVWSKIETLIRSKFPQAQAEANGKEAHGN